MPASTRARLSVEGTAITDVVGFSFSDDCLAVGDESTITVVNKDGKHTASLRLGQLCDLEMSNPEVNAGAWELRHRGRIVTRDASTGELQVTIADLGWHLRESKAPLYTRLKKATYGQLCDPNGDGILAERSTGFGLVGLRAENRSLLRQSLRLSRGQAQADDQRVTEQIHVVQVEPGDTYLDKMTEYARRLNLLVNVSPDGYVQLFTPNYRRLPMFQIVRRRGESNVLDARMHEDLKTRWTEVEVVGEQLAFEKINDPNDPNATKKRGRVTQRSRTSDGAELPQELRNPWPFSHRHTVADGEMYNASLAKRQAEWIYKKGLFDSFYVEYTLADHYQRSAQFPDVAAGFWWTSDQMVQVDDEEFGLSGVFWIQSIRGESGSGDLTRVLVRRPGLLTAAFGRYATPPREAAATKGTSTSPESP